jgi:hypothetical protein
MTWRPTRGWVVVREEKRRSSIIVDPGFGEDVARQTKTHRGRVLAIGPPALLHGFETVDGVKAPRDWEVPHLFEVGDIVQFHFEGTEKGRTTVWSDGESCLCMAQREIDAVIEGGES